MCMYNLWVCYPCTAVFCDDHYWKHSAISIDEIFLQTCITGLQPDGYVMGQV